MLRKTRNPSRLDFSDEEMDIIDQITITLALVFEKVIENISAEKLLQQSSKISSSLQYETTVVYTIKLISLYDLQGRFTDEIKEEIAKMLSEGHQQHLLHNESLMSKVLKNFENDGVIFKIKEKKNIKLQSPKSIKRKPKVGKPRHVGPYIVSKLTRSVEDYKRILTNPRALDLINNKLSKHKLLGKMYSTIIREAFNAFENGDENFYNALKMFKAIFTDVDDTSLPDPKLFQEQIKLLSEGDKENLAQQTKAHFLENPNYPIFFIFSLYKLTDYDS